jgi:hypothetical protein
MRHAVTNAGAKQAMIDLLRTALDCTWNTPEPRARCRYGLIHVLNDTGH